jgi:hypothetical protein
VTGAIKDAIIARRGKEAKNIAKVAAARRLLTLVYYGMRDGQIRCLAKTPGGSPPANQAARAARTAFPWPAAGARSPIILPRGDLPTRASP